MYENKEGLTRKAPETSQACMQKRELRCRTCNEALHLTLIRSTSAPVISQIYWEIFVKDSETYCKASLAISAINFWAAMDTNLVLHIDNHEYQHSWHFWIAISKKPKSKIMVDLGRDTQRLKQIWKERMRVAKTANWFDLKHPSLLAKTVGRVRMFTHGCQDIGIHSCSSSALQAHLESGNYPYQSRLRHTTQCPETITGVTYTHSLCVAS